MQHFFYPCSSNRRPRRIQLERTLPSVSTPRSIRFDHLVTKLTCCPTNPEVELSVQDHTTTDACANRKKRQGKFPVDPLLTSFRVGSLSMLPTAFAVLHLVEQGKLDIDTDVNQYLKDVSFPKEYSQPLTVRQLLYQTSGFDTYSWIGELGVTPQDQITLKDYIGAVQPGQIHIPGTILTRPGIMKNKADPTLNKSYAVYDYLVLGYLVEAVTGTPFEQYLKEEIFPMLQVSYSTFHQPVPAQMKNTFSPGYEIIGPYANQYPNRYINATPSLAFSVAPHDLAQFVRVFLNTGHLDGNQILDPESVRLMTQPQFAYTPVSSGQAVAFSEYRYNGQAGLYLIDESLKDYSSAIYLFPDRQIEILLFSKMEKY